MIHNIVSNIQPNALEKNNFILNFDGCSKGNPGLSGAGAVIYNNNIEVWAGYSFVDTSATNNQAEYTGLIIGLKYAVEYKIQDILVQGDSQLVINCATGKWNRKANLDLWKEFDQQSKNKRINFNWVKGHSGNKYNEMVDKIAYEEAKKIRV